MGEVGEAGQLKRQKSDIRSQISEDGSTLASVKRLSDFSGD
jgi:hypothetical protein